LQLVAKAQFLAREIQENDYLMNEMIAIYKEIDETEPLSDEEKLKKRKHMYTSALTPDGMEASLEFPQPPLVFE
jgi:hypothetical protein